MRKAIHLFIIICLSFMLCSCKNEQDIENSNKNIGISNTEMIKSFSVNLYEDENINIIEQEEQDLEINKEVDEHNEKENLDKNVEGKKQKITLQENNNEGGNVIENMEEPKNDENTDEDLSKSLNNTNENSQLTIISSDRWYKPLEKGTILVGYSENTKKIDIGGNEEGTPVYAPANGMVYYIEKNIRCGNNIVFLHVLVNDEKFTVIYYSLLDINVKLYDIVNPSTIIGTVGGHTTSSFYGGIDECSTGAAHISYKILKGWVFPGRNPIKPIDIPTKKGETWNER